MRDMLFSLGPPRVRERPQYNTAITVVVYVWCAVANGARSGAPWRSSLRPTAFV